MKRNKKELYPALWKGNYVAMIDQTLLPREMKIIKCRTYKDVADAIRAMKIRGAPAIGVSAAMGIALGAKQTRVGNMNDFAKEFHHVCAVLSKTRPTAVNLFWAIARMKTVFLAEKEKNTPVQKIKNILVREALSIFKDDVENNRKMGRFGQSLFQKNSRILTHCNAGALATGGYGTAVGVIRAAHEARKNIFVYADETRPYLQGARLTAFELKTLGIPHALVCDNMAGHLMAQGKIDAVVVGADRIARNGDTANKIGTYSLSVLAKHHGIPFYVAAPLSTIDMTLSSGKQIPIEERSSNEVVKIKNVEIAPRGTKALHPAFDVTPAKHIHAIITERGITRRPFYKTFKKWLKRTRTLDP